MATLIGRPSAATRATVDRATGATADAPAPVHPSIDQMTDRQTGLIAVGIIGGLGLLLVAILTSIVIYSFSWGYALQL
jgi:hypothetical protein